MPTSWAYKRARTQRAGQPLSLPSLSLKTRLHYGRLIFRSFAHSYLRHPPAIDMRSPVIAFGIFAATVSPTLIAAAPVAPVPGANSVTSLPHSATGPLPAGLGITVNGATPYGALSGAPGSPAAPGSKRADDGMTAGGNAHSGNAGPSDGGRIANEADPDDTLTSDDASKCLQIFASSYMLMLAQTSVATVTPASARRIHC